MSYKNKDRKKKKELKKRDMVTRVRFANSQQLNDPIFAEKTAINPIITVSEVNTGEY